MPTWRQIEYTLENMGSVCDCVCVLQDEEQLFQQYKRLREYTSDQAHLDSIMQELGVASVRRGGREGEGEEREGR